MNRRPICWFFLASALSVTGCGPGAPSAGVDIPRYCAAFVSCQNGMTSTGVANCLIAETLEVAIGISNERRRAIDCYTSAPSCVAATECISRMRGPSYCNSHQGITCDGTVRVTCAPDQAGVTEDCALLGLECRPSGPGLATCTNNRMCLMARTACNGNVITTCDGMGAWEFSADCDRVQRGSRCAMVVESGVMVARCVTEGMACDPASFVQRCAAGGSVICPETTRRETTVPCRAEETCSVAGGRATCAPAITDCTEPENDMCVGSSIQVCIRGRRTLVPCSVLGATSCMVNGTQASCR